MARLLGVSTVLHEMNFQAELPRPWPLPDLVRHPGAEIAVFGLGFVRLHKLDAGSAARDAVAIENHQVPHRVAPNMNNHRGERLARRRR